MKIHDVEQGSVDWQLARSGIPTASEFKNFMTPKFEFRKGEMVQTYLAAKLAEWWQGGPLAEFGTFDMEQGQILENEARPWYSLATGQDVTKVGFVTTDDGKFGCSPDGLIGEEGGIEIKCPLAKTHVKYLLAGVLPEDYACQVHGSLYVTGRPWWRFLSYRRRFPNLLLAVNRDEAIMEKIGEALADFTALFEEGKEKMIAANGGIEPRRPTLSPRPAPETAQATWDDQVGIKP